LVSCSKTTIDDRQDARLSKLEAAVSQLAKPSVSPKNDASIPADGPTDDVVADKLASWRELFGGKVPTAIKRGDIEYTWGGTIPKETPIFPIKAEFADGSTYELCFFKDNYREWKSFPKGNLDAGLR
jgi:hypothetical protein